MLSLKCAYAYDRGDGDGLIVHCAPVGMIIMIMMTIVTMTTMVWWFIVLPFNRPIQG